MTSYKTIKESGEAEYVIQRSRFLAHTAHVENEAEARSFLAAQKKQYFDARHNCSAWILGETETGQQQKSNDDGEPGGTAGNPILETMKKNGLTNSIVVVTRYFGGIKLGAGGLIRAYSHAAMLGLEASGIAENRLFQRIRLQIDYAMLGTIDHFLMQKEVLVAERNYAEDVILTLLLEPENAVTILSNLTELTAGKAKLQDMGNEFRMITTSRFSRQ